MLLPKFVISQVNYLKQFINMYPKERRWILKHPFIIYTCLKITNEAQNIANEMIWNNELDGDYNGGQVDAFRHTLWMAMLAQKINWKKAYSLGITHEEKNKTDFEKKTLEEGKLPDSVSCEMDMRNNMIGIAIGVSNKKMPKDELIQLVKENVKKGNCWIIKKDEQKNYLDTNNKIIEENLYLGKWNNPKVIVTSDYKFTPKQD